MAKPRKMRRVLFVDDESQVHSYEREISKELGLKPRFAFLPEQAKAIIAKRLAAIDRLMKLKISLLEKTRDPAKANALRQQLHMLRSMKKKPFALIVSDINMPRRIPSGVGFAEFVRKNFPRQKIMIHSDDLENILFLELTQEIPATMKLSLTSPPKKLLKKAIKKRLRLKPAKR